MCWMPEMRGQLRTCAALLALTACAGDSPGSGRTSGEDAMGEERPPAAMAGAPALAQLKRAFIVGQRRPRSLPITIKTLRIA
jgi:hypothetical protein